METIFVASYVDCLVLINTCIFEVVEHFHFEIVGQLDIYILGLSHCI